jgi:hypothetical protein
MKSPTPVLPVERKALEELIADFRLSNWADDLGDGLPLVDRITSGGTITEGLRQIELLADEIACFYAERITSPPPQPAPGEVRVLTEREIRGLMDACVGRSPRDLPSAIQRKFAEVNGLHIKDEQHG